MSTKIGLEEFMRLIRWKNVLMILLTQGIVKFVLIDDDVNASAFLSFFLLTLATCLVASAGYLINNIEDCQIDLQNGTSTLRDAIIFHKKKLYIVYFLLNTCAFLLAFVPAYYGGHFVAFLIFPFSIMLLYYYSKKWKSSVLMGNLLVSLLTFTSIIVVPLFENAFSEPILSTRLQLIFTYACFAFLVNLIREIVKDIEDVEGDRLFDIGTLATRYGVLISKKISMALIVFTSIGIMLALNPFAIKTNKYLLLPIIQITLVSSGIYIWYRLRKASQKEDFTACSFLLKVYMLMGILSMFLIPTYN